MKINANLTPSMLNKWGKPTSKLTLGMTINLEDLSNVDGDGRQNNQVIVWDESEDKYVHAYITGSLPGGQPGDTLYYSFNTGEEWLATDNLFNDGNNIGINTLLPEEQFHVDGNVKISENMIFSSSDDPSIVPEDESYLYLTSESFSLYGYSKAVALKTMLETGEEVIISSTLV